MTWAAGTTYSDQFAQLDQEATRLASAIAAHIEETDQRDSASLSAYLRILLLAHGAEGTT